MEPLANPLLGDTAYRVTVPLPQSLKVLNDSARKFFGYTGQIRLYLRGVFPIVSDQQLSSVKDEDVIIITWDDVKLTSKQVSQMITTHQADFAVPARAQPSERRPREQPEPYQPYRVTDQTAYQSSYVKYDLERTQPPCSPRHMFPETPNGKKTGTTSYSEEYSRKNLPERPKGIRHDDETWKPGKFNGETTYNVMFTAQKVPSSPSRFGGGGGPSGRPQPPGSAPTTDRSGDPSNDPRGGSSGDRRRSPDELPNDSRTIRRTIPETDRPTIVGDPSARKFEGVSTYSEQFLVRPLEPGPKGYPSVFDDYKPHCLGNESSEYRTKYVPQAVDNARVHLEPELGKLPQTVPYE